MAGASIAYGQAQRPLPDAGDWFVEVAGHSDWRYHESGCIVTSAGDVYTYQGDKPGQRADDAGHDTLYDGAYLSKRLGADFVVAPVLNATENKGLADIGPWLRQAAKGKLAHKQDRYDAGERAITAWFRVDAAHYQAVVLAGDGDFVVTNPEPAAARTLARLKQIARTDCDFKRLF
jgi:hypothetical protein